MRRFSLPDLRRLGGERWTTGSAFALAQLPAVPTFQELRPALEGELRRSRRYERPLALLVVLPGLDPVHAVNGNGASSQNGHGVETYSSFNGSTVNGSSVPSARELADAVTQPHVWAQVQFLALASVLFGTLRETDIVSYAPEVHQFVALLPECTAPAAGQAVERLRRLHASRTGADLRAGSAVYPADGLTLDDLLAHARQVLANASVLRAMMHTNGNGASHA